MIKNNKKHVPIVGDSFGRIIMIVDFYSTAWNSLEIERKLNWKLQVSMYKKQQETVSQGQNTQF